jgi:hypothetical protein
MEISKRGSSGLVKYVECLVSWVCYGLILRGAQGPISAKQPWKLGGFEFGNTNSYTNKYSGIFSPETSCGDLQTLS